MKALRDCQSCLAEDDIGTRLEKSSSRLLCFLALLALIGVGGCSEVALAAPMSISVPLTGAEQVPPVQTSGKGTAELTYDPDTRIVTWRVTFSDLSGPATMAHFHGPAMAGKNGPVILWLTNKGSPAESPIKGNATLTPDQAKEFSAGQWYINVHTSKNPTGEIRGQVTPPKG
jgi:hypothetical protein